MKDYLRTIALKSVSNIYNTQKLPHNQHELYGELSLGDIKSGKLRQSSIT